MEILVRHTASDSSEVQRLRQIIEQKNTELSHAIQRNEILEHVYITDIFVRRINDSQILVSYSLNGIDSLKSNGYKDPPRLLLKVFDEQNKTYIEMIEKNPITGESKIQYASCLIKYNNAEGNIYHDNCYFINTQDKPFSKGLFNLNLKPKRFTFQFYLPGISRPLSYYPSTLKK